MWWSLPMQMSLDLTVASVMTSGSGLRYGSAGVSPSWCTILYIMVSLASSLHRCSWLVGWLCWGLTSQSTIFQSCRDGAIASWVINQYFRGVKCLAQGHNTAAVGFEPRTSRSGVRHSTTEPPRSPHRCRVSQPSFFFFFFFFLVHHGGDTADTQHSNEYSQHTFTGVLSF